MGLFPRIKANFVPFEFGEVIALWANEACYRTELRENQEKNPLFWLKRAFQSELFLN